MKAMYPGTFDPITNGHLDIIKRAAKMFDCVYVCIMKNPRKKAMFDENVRKKMIEKCLVDLENVQVIIGEGLTVEFAKKYNCQALIRGIRAVADYEYELQQATANMMLDDQVETIFFVSRPQFSFLSSSVAKEIAYLNGDISKFVPPEIANQLKQIIKK